jgi:hypothetical protein
MTAQRIAGRNLPFIALFLPLDYGTHAVSSADETTLQSIDNNR